MKRLLLGMTIVGGAAILAGCPIYPDNGPSYYGGVDCRSSYDCGTGYYCDNQGYCDPTPPASEEDSGSGPSDPCGGCPANTTCTLFEGELQCIPNQGNQSDAGPIGDASTSFDAGSPGDATFFTDAGDAALTEGGTAARTCNADVQCAGTLGSRCIDGLCTPQAQLCSDGSQCFAAGSACVNGVCVPTCSTSSSCPTGYACDFNHSVCTVNPSSCSTSAECQGGAVCVESRCVAPCSNEAGPLATGTVCVNGGAIPDEAARLTCQNEGAACDATSICLHGGCYPVCDGEGGGCAAGLSCTSVTITKGAFAVCGVAGQLGSDCDPQVGTSCAAPAVCITGFCK
jgi:hypothetical protein